MMLKKKISLFLMMILSLLFPDFAAAGENFFDQRYRGWLWFEEKEQEVKMKDANSKSGPSLQEMQQAKEENEQFAAELELLRHMMIRYPDNLEHIKRYKLKEKEMYDRAVLLGRNWLMVNFLNPDIVDELENPQNIYGRDIKKRETKKEQNSILKELAQDVEIFVFRQDGCPYCQLLEKHLFSFASKHGFKVEAVSADNSTSEYFKTNFSKEMIEALELEVMPTVIAVNINTRERFELARGTVSIPELEDKALLMAEYMERRNGNN